MPAGDAGFGLALAIVVGVVYLVVVRLVDLNEREPFWALALALFVGALAGAILPIVIDPDVLELEVLAGALAIAVAMFVALTALLAVLEAVGRLRGWAEVNGVMDGIVYGAAVGLGFAIGDAFYREATFGASPLAIDPSPFTTLWTTALAGLSQGIFGAIIGAALGAALQGRSATERLGYPVAGLAAAFLAQAAYIELDRGDALGGSAGAVRAWIALLLPVAFVVLAAARALARERGAIAEELADEAKGGVVTEADLHLLRNAAARRGEYARRLFSGDLDGWIALRALQNRQVQLALTEHRARRESDPERKAELLAQAERLRAAVHSSRQVVERVSGPGVARAGCD